MRALQLIHAVTGTSLGPTAGIVILGLFFPWTTPKGATIGYFTGLIFGWWASIGRLTNRLPYYTAPLSSSGCNATVSLLFNMTSNITEFTTAIIALEDQGAILSDNITQAIITPEADIFPLYSIIPVWYTSMTMLTVITVGLSASIILGAQDPEKIDPKLISPLFYTIFGLFPKRIQEQLGYKSLDDCNCYKSCNTKKSNNISRLKITAMQNIQSTTEEMEKLKENLPE